MTLGWQAFYNHLLFMSSTSRVISTTLRHMKILKNIPSCILARCTRIQGQACHHFDVNSAPIEPLSVIKKSFQCHLSHHFYHYQWELSRSLVLKCYLLNSKIQTLTSVLIHRKDHPHHVHHDKVRGCVVLNAVLT